MKLIQSYNTFGGEFMNAGFSTKRSFLKYINETIPHHLSLTSNFYIYTDNWGYDFLYDFLPNNLELIHFPIIDDRFWNIGKFQVQELQTEPYIHIDLDAKLLEIPNTNKSVMCENIRLANIGKSASYLKLKHFTNIPCSGLIGFNDINLKDNYISKVFDLISKSKSLKEISFETMWTIEELLLANLVDTYDVYILKNEHLQGKMK